jgi:type IV pilus assembly protein PilA
MKSLMKMMRGGQKGFTLIELLIVVAILGIIAAVVIPNIASFMTSGQLAAANSEAEQVKTASLGFFADNGFWTTTSGNLSPQYVSGTLRAEYTFDPDYGWIIGATPTDPDGWTGIEWTGFQTGELGQHGKWTRIP